MILFYLKCDFSIKEKRIKKSAIDLSTCLSTKTIIDDRPDKMFYTKSIQDLFNLKSASNLNGNLNCSKELEHYAS